MYLLNFKVGLWFWRTGFRSPDMKDWVDGPLSSLLIDRSLVRMWNWTAAMEELMLCSCFLLLAFILFRVDPESIVGFGRLPRFVIRLGWKKDLQWFKTSLGLFKEKYSAFKRLFVYVTPKWVHSVTVTFKKTKDGGKNKIEIF